MSDFTSSFWTGYVTLLTLGGIFACLILLYLTGRKRVGGSTSVAGRSLGNPPVAGSSAAPPPPNTTGHVWDVNLREANNPLPRWWVGLFVLTIVFAVGYLIVYPGLGAFGGQFNWSARDQYMQEMDAATHELEPIYSRFVQMPIPDVARDPQANAIGERLFMNNCSQCHGSDARGSKGFPNLTDKDWLHGGSPEQILETITKGRIGIMPPMVSAVGSADDVRNVANYVLSLSSSPHDPVKAALGRSKFTACAACHGFTGGGNPVLGAPNLGDKVWLHGFGVEAISNMVNNGKRNEMPAQEGRLTDAQIRVLAAYVWGLSNEGAANARLQSASSSPR